MVAAAGPLLALTLTDDVRLISFVSFAAMIPWLVLSLPLGVVIDRVERRRLLTLSSGVRGGLYGIVALLVLSAFAARTMKQLTYWQNGETLFRHAIAVTDDNYTAYDNLGQYLHEQRTGRDNEAINYLRKALQIKPGDMDSLTNLSAALVSIAEHVLSNLREDPALFRVVFFGLMETPHLASEFYQKFVSRLLALETRLFEPAAIPWDELAFPSVRLALEAFLADRARGAFTVHALTVGGR